MIDLEELKVKHAESDKSASKYLECAGMLMRAFPAIVAKLEALERGEFICKSCGHRKDADASKIDPPF